MTFRPFVNGDGVTFRRFVNGDGVTFRRFVNGDEVTFRQIINGDGVTANPTDPASSRDRPTDPASSRDRPTDPASGRDRLRRWWFLCDLVALVLINCCALLTPPAPLSRSRGGCRIVVLESFVCKW